MTGGRGALAAASLFALIASALATGPVLAGEKSFGVRLGYFLPTGDWKEHRYANGVDQFGGGIAAAIDLEWKLMRQLGLALSAGYTRFSMDQWEDYAAANGDPVDASAQMACFGLLIKPYLWSNERQALKFNIGLDIVFPDGNETFQGETYEYDFLKKKLGFSLGLEFTHAVGKTIDLAFNVAYFFVPGGIEYADGVTYSITGIPATVGLRFRF